MLQWLPTEWSACPIECGARCTQHRDFQCRCSLAWELGSWDLAKRFSEDICTRSIRSAVLPVAPNPISRLHGAIGLYAKPQACVLRIMGNSGRMTTRYVELPACSAVQYTWSVNRPTAIRHHRRTCAFAWLALVARSWAAHRRVSRWTGWRLSGVRAQSRAVWGSSSAWCASLPSSFFELLLVHRSMSPAQHPRVPVASA